VRIAYANLVDSADTITATASNSNWPVENIQSTLLGTAWQSLVCSTDQYVTMDAGAGLTFTVTCAIVSGHNLSSAATIVFEMDNDANFASVDVQETITWRSDHAVKFFTGGSYRYMRFKFTDAANTDGYISIGRLFAGTYTEIAPSSVVPFKILNARNDNKQVTDQYCVYGEIGESKRVFSFEFPPSAIAMITTWRTVYDTVGKVKPIWFFDLNTVYTNIAPAYCTIDNDLEESWNGNMITYNLVLRECN
jgi:hypothetical protein